MAVSANDNPCAPLVTGGYDCDFVDPPPDSLQCPVCLLPLRDPNLLSCCGHKGCASCIGRIKAAGHPCPLCQQPFETMLDKHFQRKVLELRVFCSNKGEGCPWKGELRDLETHSRSACAFVEEECRYGCGRRYRRRFLHNHEMDECPQRPPEIFMQSLIKKMAERIDKLEAIHDKARQEDQTKLTAFQAKLAAVEKAHDEAEAKFTIAEEARLEEHTKLSKQIQELRNENVSLKDDKQKLITKMEQLQHQLQQETEQRKAYEELKHQVECQNTTLRLHSQIVATYCPGWLMDTKGTLSSPYPPKITIMPRFSQHMRDDDSWFSQPFYSWPGGYKLCLRVDANGGGSGSGTHVSVFVHVMKGENDHQLQWPFKHNVTYGILNWKRDENHGIETITFQTTSAKGQQRVTSQERSETGWGYGKFLPHSSLAAKDTQYLHNDCLCLQVFKVKPPK